MVELAPRNRVDKSATNPDLVDGGVPLTPRLQSRCSVCSAVKVARLQTANRSHMSLEHLQGHVDPEPPVAKHLHGERVRKMVDLGIEGSIMIRDGDGVLCVGPRFVRLRGTC